MDQDARVAGESSSGPAQASPSFKPLPEHFACTKVGVDLTFQAKEGLISRLMGRDAELEQMLSLLSDRVRGELSSPATRGLERPLWREELAHRIVDGTVPPHLKKTRIIQTSFADIWGHVANSTDWGKYLNILKDLMTECLKLPAILFMDEIHSIFGHHYTMQYIRPYLSSGRLCIIGATTAQEYYTFLEKDRATARRFHCLKVEETGEETTLGILKSYLAEDFRSREGDDLQVPLPNESVLAYLISLSNAYIPYQFQPAKALDILDEVLSTKRATLDSSEVSRKDVRRSVCKAVGIPEEAISSKKEQLQAMEEVLNAHILGQQEAIACLCRRLIISKAGLSVTPERPDGVFLLAGPTGVGKTELAKALAAYLTGSDTNLIRVDMSTYADRGSINR